MARPVEEIIFEGFKGWSPYQNLLSNLVLPRRLREGELIDAEGVRIGYDGVVRWHRDQFQIETTGLPASPALPRFLMEYKAAGYNQMLALYDDGKLYKLETDWPNATATQVAAAYEVFHGVSWSEAATGLQTSGPFGLLQCEDVLLVGHRSAATQRWDGVDLTNVGFATPTACFVGSSDFSGYTEVDAGDYLTVAADRITALLMPKNSTAYTYEDFGADVITDFVARWNFQITASSGDGAHLYMVGCKNSVGVFSGTTDWFAAGVRRRGTDYTITISYGALESWITTPLSLSTTYYAELKRVGNRYAFTVYSDAGYTTQVATIKGYDGTAYRYLYAGCAYGGGAEADTINGYIDTLTMTVATIGSGQLPAGTYSYYTTFASDEFESMSSNITDIVVSSADSNITLGGILTGPTGTTSRKLYRAYTDAVAQGSRGTSFQFLAEISDNTTTTYTDDALQASLANPLIFDHAIPPRGDILAWHNNRVFMANCASSSQSYEDYDTTNLRNVVFFSELNEPYYWPSVNYFRVGDETDIKALVPWRNFLLIFKENSVWVLFGYESDEFELERVSGEVGCTNREAAAAGPPGVVWQDSDGIMFYNGSSIRRILEFGYASGGYQPPDSSVDVPTVAYHRGEFWVGTNVIHIYNPETDHWQQERLYVSSIRGIRAFNFGRHQSHILAYSVAGFGGSSFPMVWDTGKQFTYWETAGSAFSDYHAPIEVTLPPLLAQPGTEIVPLEVWIDGPWTDYATAAYRPKLFINNDADYSETAGQNAWATTPYAPKDGGVIGVPSGYSYSGGASKKTNAFAVLYIQIKATHAEDFVLNGVGLRYYVRPARG